MENSKSASYAAAGVDVTAGYESVERIKPLVESTFREGVLGGLGGFGGTVDFVLNRTFHSLPKQWSAIGKQRAVSMFPPHHILTDNLHSLISSWAGVL